MREVSKQYPQPAGTRPEVEPFHKGRIDRPATRRQDLLNGQLGAEHHAVFDPDEASAPIRLDNLRVKQCGQRHPPWLRAWPFVLASLGLPPLTKIRQQCRAIILEAIGQKQWDTA